MRLTTAATGGSIAGGCWLLLEMLADHMCRRAALSVRVLCVVKRSRALEQSVQSLVRVHGLSVAVAAGNRRVLRALLPTPHGDSMSSSGVSILPAHNQAGLFLRLFLLLLLQQLTASASNLLRGCCVSIIRVICLCAGCQLSFSLPLLPQPVQRMRHRSKQCAGSAHSRCLGPPHPSLSCHSTCASSSIPARLKCS